MYRHSGPLSKGQMGGWNTVYRHTGPLSKGQMGGENTVYRHSGPLSKSQRGGGRRCTDTQDLYLKVRWEVGTPSYILTGLLSKGQRTGGNTV